VGIRFEASIVTEKRILTLRGAQVAVNRLLGERSSQASEFFGLTDVFHVAGDAVIDGRTFSIEALA
jgi:hypothetical protein